jgi:hypothetical protein
MFWKKKPSESKDPRLEPVRPPVRQALILICEKCGKKIQGKDNENPSKDLQGQLKERLKAEFGKGYARPILTSCFDLCPKGKIALAVTKLAPKEAQGSQFFEVDKGDQNTVITEILSRIQAP